MKSQQKEEWTDVQVDVKDMVGHIALTSSKSYIRLNQIDRIRAYGLSNHIALPQLVVCGDQSSGKSSVLEGITGIPFPRKDGLCTRFATEIILRHQIDSNSITATILPSDQRSAAKKAELERFRHCIASFNELPAIIEAAATAMDIRGYSDMQDPPPFTRDVLRLEVVGNTGLHLTVVDLPGLISGADDDDGATIVDDLVSEYMSSSRTIILAVIQANNDIDTESIIRRAKKFDQTGDRTVGIITKPDLINKGTEPRVAALTKDRRRLKLGFFLLKNPSPSQLSEGVSSPQRVEQERLFFATSPWREQSIDRNRAGVDNLRIFLQELLDRHIERELPKVRQDIFTLLLHTKAELDRIGTERSTADQMRTYLIHISMHFYNLCKAALDGGYDGLDASFFSLDGNGFANRLRAVVHTKNTDFAAYMRDNAAKRKLVPVSSETPREDCVTIGDDEQMLLTTAEMASWVKDASVAHFVSAALTRAVPDLDVRRNLQDLINEKLDLNYNAALTELEKLLADEQYHPITYNHYLTDNVQKARQQKVSDRVQRSIRAYANSNGKLHVGNTQAELDNLVSGLQSNIEVDMDKQGCNEALDTLKSYYKVSMKTFVDNVTRQVLERHILRGLISVFNPSSIGNFNGEELERFARETHETQRRRQEQTDLKQCLEQSLKELRD